MSRRFQIVLSDPVATQLHELAVAAGEPPSTVAAQFVRSGVSEAARDGKVRPLRPRAALTAQRSLSVPSGLSLTAGIQLGAVRCGVDRRAAWSLPAAARGAKEGWWRDEVHTEILCALAVWRGEIDDAGENPREELAFHRQLADYADALRQQGGGVSKAWKPGAPPPSGLRRSALRVGGRATSTSARGCSLGPCRLPDGSTP